jgi:predicted ATPase with chaperone activity
MRAKQTKKVVKRIEEEALQKLRDPRFLYNASQKVAELGVVGEKRNRLTMILACITRHTPDPVSIILQAPPGSGKTTLMRKTVRLFPPDYVTERAGLSKKALAFGKRSLQNTILVINEYKCGKDAQLFIRLTQSGEDIKHDI